MLLNVFWRHSVVTQVSFFKPPLFSLLGARTQFLYLPLCLVMFISSKPQYLFCIWTTELPHSQNLKKIFVCALLLKRPYIQNLVYFLVRTLYKVLLFHSVQFPLIIRQHKGTNIWETYTLLALHKLQATEQNSCISFKECYFCLKNKLSQLYQTAK